MHRVERPNDSDIENVEKSILRYFVRNPCAADSAEGVARWRLLHERIDHSVEQTREALRILVSKGYVLEETSPVSGPIFRLNLAKRGESEALLRKLQQKG